MAASSMIAASSHLFSPSYSYSFPPPPPISHNHFSFHLLKNAHFPFRTSNHSHHPQTIYRSPLHPFRSPRPREFVRAASSEDDGTPAELPMVVCFGEMLIDFVPTVGGVSLAEAPAFKKAPGGAPANVAVGIARLGGRSAFIGKVGDDEFGYMLADILKQNNVENDGLLFDKNARTALAFVTLRSDGEREFMFFRNPSADMLLQESELNVAILQKIKHNGKCSDFNRLMLA